MRIPIKISPCPIQEAAVEIRFESNFPSDAVFGLIYNAFKSEYTGPTEKLPILQLPDFVRTKDPNLTYQPHYKLTKNGFILQIGPKVISINNVNKYVGWADYSKKIFKSIEKMKKLNLITKLVRIGIRYINFFELDIYKNINLDLKLSKKPFISEQLSIRSLLKTGRFLTNLQVLNHGNIFNKHGSIIDIDTYIEKLNERDFENLESVINEGHNKEKEVFFTLLKSDFLNQFHPEYKK
jgi:uncharacterized protein (TIGR04255 family)